VTTRRSVLLAGSVGLLVPNSQSLGQTGKKIPRIGILWFSSIDTPSNSQNRAVLGQRLATLGYVEGKTIVIEDRSAEGHAERLGEFARALVASKVDIIVTVGVTASRAARQATSTIPIVMLHAGDPVGAGLGRVAMSPEPRICPMPANRSSWCANLFHVPASSSSC
jgi:putative ABC transport system substrate-binding protein